MVPPATPDLRDMLGRPLRSLRVSVTDRCNLRCQYCMPEEEYTWLRRGDLLTFEEIRRLVDVFTELGVDKVRLTGGEPLLRRDLPDLVRLLAAVPAVRDLAMTSNGVLLAGQAAAAPGGRPPPGHGQPRHPPSGALPGAHAAGRPRRRPPGDRGRPGGRVPGSEARHRGHPGRQRGRAGRPRGVRPARRRRGAVHRVHGRGGRHALVPGAGGLARGDARAPGGRGMGRSSRFARRRPLRPSGSAFSTARRSASSPRRRRPSAGPATGAGSRPTARGTCASTLSGAWTSGRRSGTGRRPTSCGPSSRAGGPGAATAARRSGGTWRRSAIAGSWSRSRGSGRIRASRCTRAAAERRRASSAVRSTVP